MDDLAKAVTCPICLDYMEDARQLHCGHLFCSECVVGMLGMEKVRCAVCKEKTGKRMVRNAPVRYDEVVKYLRVLEDILVECNVRPKKTASINDGYGSLPNAAMVRLQNAAMQRQSLPVTPVRCSKSENQVATPMHRSCYLCPKGVDALTFGDKVSFGAMTPAVSERKRTLFVHERCALFSDDVYEGSGAFQNVEKLVQRTNKIVCGRDACGRTRANINCGAQGCKVRYHFPCAVVEGCVLVEDGFKIFCPAHKEIAPVIDEREFKKTLSDPNDAVVKLHDDCCYLCHRGGKLLMCDTCERVAHPVCSGLKSIPLGDWSCGVCTGAEHIIEGAEKKKSSSKKPSLKRRREQSDSPYAEVGEEDLFTYTPTVGKMKKRARKSAEGSKRYVLAHTGLHELETESLKGIAKAKKTMVRSDIDRRVTHLIIRPYTKDEYPRRTMKLCKAIAAKIPVVCWKWVEESTESESWISVDQHLHPLSWPKDEPPVFEGLRFYFGAYNGPKEKKDDLSSVVVLGGGSLVYREPSLDTSNNGTLMYVRDEEVEQRGRGELPTRYEPPSGVKTIPSTWILDRCTKDRNL